MVKQRVSHLPTLDRMREMLKAGKSAELLASADRRSAANPDDPWAHKMRAKTFEYLKRYDEAIEHVRWLLAHEPESLPMNHFWLADLLATVGDFPNAILHFSEVIATKEPYFINIAHFFRAECHLRVKEYAKAIEDIESVPVGLPYYPRPREMVLDEAMKGLASDKK